MNQTTTDMKKSIKILGFEDARGTCLHCGISWSGQDAALDAITHHDATGHRVRVEQTIWWERSKQETASPPIIGTQLQTKLPIHKS